MFFLMNGGSVPIRLLRGACIWHLMVLELMNDGSKQGLSHNFNSRNRGDNRILSGTVLNEVPITKSGTRRLFSEVA